jgi:hypothetical protein
MRRITSGPDLEANRDVSRSEMTGSRQHNNRAALLGAQAKSRRCVALLTRRNVAQPTYGMRSHDTPSAKGRGEPGPVQRRVRPLQRRHLGRGLRLFQEAVEGTPVKVAPV